MLKKRQVARFAREWIMPNLPGFHLHDSVEIVRIARPLLHGIVFDRSSCGKDSYVSCFVDFLTNRRDFTALSFGDRLVNPDGSDLCSTLEPAPEQASLILEAMQRSRYSPFNLVATCNSVLHFGESETANPHNAYGLATCAIFESDPGLARTYFDIVRAKIDPPERNWEIELLNRISIIEESLEDLSRTQALLRRWVEETISLRGLQHLV